MNPIHFAFNESTLPDLLVHLQRADSSFMPPLSQRVDIPAYASKLLAKALRFEAWAEDELIGLVAVYADHERGQLFISNVSVEQAWQGQGIARKLMDPVLLHAKTSGIGTLSLEVNPDNQPAIRLYTTLGFESVPDKTGASLTMSLTMTLHVSKAHA